jgi:hypothetical protein
MSLNRELPPNRNAWKHLRRPTAWLARTGRCGGCAGQDVTTFRGSGGRGQRFAAGQLRGQFGSVGASNRASEIQVHEALRLTHAFAGGEFKRLAEREGFEPSRDERERAARCPGSPREPTRASEARELAEGEGFGLSAIL